MSEQKIIKDGEGAGAAQAFSFADVEIEARQIIARAHTRAGQILAEARGVLDDARKAKDFGEAERRRLAAAFAEIEKRKGDGFEDGRREGFEAGKVEGLEAGRVEGHAKAYEDAFEQALAEKRAELAEEIAVASAAFEQSVDAIEEERNDLTSGAHARLLDLAVDIAALVAGRQIEAVPDTVVDAVRAAVDLSLKQGEVTVRLHPEDAVLVEKHIPGLVESFRRVTAIHLEPEESVDRGGCVVLSAGGAVDARMQTKLEEIRRQLKE